jgi:hypothetical protein
MSTTIQCDWPEVANTRRAEAESALDSANTPEQIEAVFRHLETFSALYPRAEHPTRRITIAVPSFVRRLYYCPEHLQLSECSGGCTLEPIEL